MNEQVLKYNIGENVSVKPGRKNAGLSSYIFGIETDEAGRDVYNVSTSFSQTLDIDQYYFEDLTKQSWGHGRIRHPKDVVSGFLHIPERIIVTSSITGSNRDDILRNAINQEEEQPIAVQSGLRNHIVASERWYSPAAYDQAYDPSGMEAVAANPVKLRAGQPVTYLPTLETMLISELGSNSVRLTRSSGQRMFATILDIAPLEPNKDSEKSKEVTFKKEDLLEVLDQDKSAEEIILDLRDHLTN